MIYHKLYICEASLQCKPAYGHLDLKPKKTFYSTQCKQTVASQYESVGEFSNCSQPKIIYDTLDICMGFLQYESVNVFSNVQLVKMIFYTFGKYKASRYPQMFFQIARL